ncbi:MAG TPA: cell division protein ZapA [Devosia sp.]|nr:cell division protein ZapA [Devosia sp.]
MPEVNVEINGRKYRMACDEGQEPHLEMLAESFNRKIDQLRGSFGEIGDNRLTVMAGIAALDELYEAQAEIQKLRQDVADLTRAGEAMAAETEEIEQKFAKQLSEAARKIESIATAIDDTGLPNS